MDTRLLVLLLLLLLLMMMMMMLLLLLLMMMMMLLPLRVLLLLLRVLLRELPRRGRRARPPLLPRPGCGLEGSASRASAHARGGRHPHHAPLPLPRDPPPETMRGGAPNSPEDAADAATPRVGVHAEKRRVGDEDDADRGAERRRRGWNPGPRGRRRS